MFCREIDGDNSSGSDCVEEFHSKCNQCELIFITTAWLFLSKASSHLHHSKPASINDSWTADKAARSGSISEMVCWTSSLVSRSHSLRIVDLSKSWKPSRTENSRSRSSKIFAITSKRVFSLYQPTGGIASITADSQLAKSKRRIVRRVIKLLESSPS